TRSRIKSSASARSRSGLPSAHRYSIATFCPSTYREGDGRRVGQDHVGAQIEQLAGELARMRRVARTPAIDELDIAALDPAQGVRGRLETHAPRLPSRVIRYPHQPAPPPHAIRRLRARRERPRRRRAAEERDELTAFHSITSSAIARRLSGTVRPSAFAAVRLMTRSKLVRLSTGRAPRLVPPKMF